MNYFHQSLSLLPPHFHTLHFRPLSLTHPPLGLELDHSSLHHLGNFLDHSLLQHLCFGHLHCKPVNCQLSQSQHQIGFLPGVLCSYQLLAAHLLLPQTSHLRLQRAHLPFGRLHQGLRFQLLFFQWQPPPLLYLQPFCLSNLQQIWFLLCLD